MIIKDILNIIIMIYYPFLKKISLTPRKCILIGVVTKMFFLLSSLFARKIIFLYIKDIVLN